MANLTDTTTDFSSDFGGVPLLTPVYGVPVSSAPAQLTWYEIPLQGRPQSLTTTINGKRVGLVTHWVDAASGGWALRMKNSAGAVVIAKIMLVPGVDLLAQYAYLGLGVVLYLYSDVPDAYPTYRGLGTTSHLVWAVKG